jgi:hypothetical protein
LHELFFFSKEKLQSQLIVRIRALAVKTFLESGAANPVSTHLAEEEFECFTSVLTAVILITWPLHKG